MRVPFCWEIASITQEDLKLKNARAVRSLANRRVRVWLRSVDARSVLEVPPLGLSVRPTLLPAVLRTVLVDKLRHVGGGDVNSETPSVIRCAWISGKISTATAVKIPEIDLDRIGSVRRVGTSGSNPDTSSCADVCPHSAPSDGRVFFQTAARNLRKCAIWESSVDH